MKYLLSFILVLITSCSPPPKKNTDGSLNQELRIGAFNIQIFGDAKYNNVPVRNHILTILPRYDLVLIQEIRDADGSSMDNLMANLNAITGNRYGVVLGSRLGRSSSKEQYAYVYDVNKISVEQSFDYPDSGDVFEREPLVTLFKSKNSGRKFFLLGLHAKPDDAFNELEKLPDVFAFAESTFGITEGMALGDFNADCSYLSDSEYQDLTLYKTGTYRFLFRKDGDSTVGASDCQYDQIVMSNTLTDNITSGSEGVYNFMEALGLSQAEAEDVSDHYPVEALFSL